MDNRIVAISLVLIIASVAYAAEDWNLGSTSIFTGVNTTDLNATNSNITNLNVTGIFNTTSVNTTNLNVSGTFRGTGFSNQSFQNLIQNGNFEFWYAGTSVAPTGWVATNVTVARESTAANIKYGTYSMLLTSTGGANDRIQNTVLSGTAYTNAIGRNYTYGVWIKSSVIVNVNILEDGLARSTSSSSGSGNWEFIKVTRTVAGGGTAISAEIFMPASVSTAYVDGAILVEGSVVPAFTEHPFDMTLDETRFKVGSFTRDVSTASGTQAITGVGFKPSIVMFLSLVKSTSKMSIGFDDGITQVSILDWSGVNPGSYESDSTQSISLYTDGSNHYIGKIATNDADGFTVQWTKTGSPTGTATLYYMAYR